MAYKCAAKGLLEKPIKIIYRVGFKFRIKYPKDLNAVGCADGLIFAFKTSMIKLLFSVVT